jgi:hypothetical protein
LPKRPKSDAPVSAIDHGISYPFFLFLICCIYELQTSFPYAFEWKENFYFELLSNYHLYSLEPVYESKFNDKTFLELFIKHTQAAV